MSEITHRPFRRAGAAKLSAKDVEVIIKTRGRIPNAARTLAAKYHTSMRRVYEIWREQSDKPQVGGGETLADRPRRAAKNARRSSDDKEAEVMSRLESARARIHGSD